MEAEKKVKRPKRRFSEEFKVEALELSKKLGPTKAGVDLGSGHFFVWLDLMGWIRCL